MFRIEAREPLANENETTPPIIRNMPKMSSIGFYLLGYISPYPTVVIVVII